MERRAIPSATKEKVRARCCGRCELCGVLPEPILRERIVRGTVIVSQIHPGYEYDHVLEVALGGTNEADNVRFLCLDCHRSETSRSNRRVRGEAAATRGETFIPWPRRVPR